MVVQTMAWLEEVIKGRHQDPANMFHWDSVVLNLPSRYEYTAYMHWVYKVRSSDARISADFMLYIDNSRPTSPSESECRQV
jgi:hypothetical protein